MLFEALRDKVDLARHGGLHHRLPCAGASEVVETLIDATARSASTSRTSRRPRMAVIDVAGTPRSRSSAASAGSPRTGLETVIATLDETAYDGSNLLVERARPAVYRQALIESHRGQPARGRRARAARRHREPFRVQVASNKKILALLQDERFEHLVTRAEIEMIRSNVPWSRILRPGRTTYGDWRFELLSFVSDNRERLVLVASTTAATGSCSASRPTRTRGRRRSPSTPSAATSSSRSTSRSRRRCSRRSRTEHVQMRLKRFNINPYCIGGRYVGMMTRIGPGGDQRRRGRRDPPERRGPSGASCCSRRMTRRTSEVFSARPARPARPAR